MSAGSGIYEYSRIVKLIYFSLPLYDHHTTVRHNLGISYVYVRHLLHTQYRRFQIICSSSTQKVKTKLTGTCRCKRFALAGRRHFEIQYFLIDIPFKLSNTRLEIIICKLSRYIRCIGFEIPQSIFEIDLCI